MYKEKLTIGVKNNAIVAVQYKSLDKKLTLAFIFSIIENIEKKLDDKRGKFFIGNFETCIDWKIV